MATKYTFFTIFLIYVVYINADVYEQLCDRLYFEHPSEDQFPYVNILSGIYVKTKRIIDGFPIYENERGVSYFSLTKNDSTFNFKKTTGLSLGIFALGKYEVIQNHFEWSLTINFSSPFGDVFEKDKWFFQVKGKRYDVAIKPKCVADTTTDCSSKPLIVMVNEAGKNLNVTSIFHPIPDEFLEYRRIYVCNECGSAEMYLFYNNGYWVIGRNVSKVSAFFSVKSTVMKPEFTTQTWRRGFPFQKSSKQVHVKFQCKLELRTNENQTKVHSLPHGVCHENTLNETKCTCQYGYAGTSCEKVVTGCSLDIIDGYLVINNEEGALAFTFYRSDSHLRYRVIQCRRFKNRSLRWYRNFTSYSLR